MDKIKIHCGSELKDTLKVYFSPIMICQQHCTYCYARNDLASHWNTIMDEKMSKSVIEMVGRSSLPISLIFLGGEPTLHPHYLELLDLWDELCNKKSDLKHMLEITTNGLRTDIFEQMRYIENLTITFSFHPTEVDFEQFFKTIKIVQDLGINANINILILEREKFYPLIRKAIARSEEMGLPIQPTLLNSYIERRKTGKNKQQEEFIKEVGKDKVGIIKTIVEVDGKDFEKDLALIDFYMQDYHFMKGITCYQGAYNIDVFGRLKNVCLDKGSGIPVLHNLDYFEKIKTMRPVTCPLESCNCSEYLIDFYKEV